MCTVMTERLRMNSRRKKTELTAEWRLYLAWKEQQPKVINSRCSFLYIIHWNLIINQWIFLHNWNSEDKIGFYTKSLCYNSFYYDPAILIA